MSLPAPSTATTPTSTTTSSPREEDLESVSTTTSRKTVKSWRKRYVELNSTEFTYRDSGSDADKSVWKLGTELVAVIQPNLEEEEKGFGVIVLEEDGTTEKTIKLQTGSFAAAKDWASSIDTALKLALKRKAKSPGKKPVVPVAAEVDVEEVKEEEKLAVAEEPVAEEPVAEKVVEAAAAAVEEAEEEEEQHQEVEPLLLAKQPTQLPPTRREEQAVAVEQPVPIRPAPIQPRTQQQQQQGWFAFLTNCCSAE
ncbi:hypothetical protein BASA82_000673 [Batrachochytrium salamandrivorans]|nr:hypothetical protein BASA81_004132 [Batrachochytrium salamandrivorans]KAH9262280.1 hypothetical protein BASA82_000673 [Batrachochytrium salamandrivorans]